MAERVHDYHEGNRLLQDRFDTRRIADRIAEFTATTLDDRARTFIERADMFFIATCDHRGLPTCSYKGGDPGFVRVLDESHIAFPNYDGNGKYQSMGNMFKSPNVGMLFIDFEHPGRLRLQGVASIQDDDPLVRSYPGAQFVVRVHVLEAYGNCPRYVHRYQLIERSKYVPHEACEPPIPEWKLRDAFRDYLPKDDPARKMSLK